MIEAFIFDVGGVILLPSGARIAAATGLSLDERAAGDGWTVAIARLDQRGAAPHELAMLPPGSPVLSPLESIWMAHAGVPPDVELDAMDAVRRENAKPRSLWSDQVAGAREALEALREQGFRLGCVSNSDGRVERELTEDGFRDLFEAVVDSSVVGIAKPDVRIHHVCLDRMGLRPEQCVYVGDTICFDVMSARAAGMRAAHFDRLGLYGKTPGIARVRELSALVGLDLEHLDAELADGGVVGDDLAGGAADQRLAER